MNRFGVPEILHNGEGERITPSVVLFENDDIIIGTYARQAQVAYPDQVVEFVKSRMGDDGFAFQYRGHAYTAEMLSSFVLSKLKHDAELRLGHRVEEAVITVPAYFMDKERRATVRAGERAGMRVLALVNEPTAAAYAYALGHPDAQERILVFDLGAGGVGVTIAQLRGTEITILATGGARDHGGREWDNALAQYAGDAFVRQHGIDPRLDPAARFDLWHKCTSAKLSLSKRGKVNLFFDYGGKILRLEIAAALYEELTWSLVQQCEIVLLGVLADAGLTSGDIDTVVLAGGSTRMPMVRTMLSRCFKKEPSLEINPDECVALGAAIVAAIESCRIAAEARPFTLLTHDVISHSLGVAVRAGGKVVNERIIHRNSPIPCERTLELTTTRAGQTIADLWLLQGEAPDPLACRTLGHFEFFGIPPRDAGAAPVSVTFRCNENGIVEVEAMDLGSGQTLPHRLGSSAASMVDVIASAHEMTNLLRALSTRDQGGKA